MGNLSCGNLDPPPSSGGQSAASSPSALHEDGLTKRFRRCRSPFREPPKSDRHPVGMVIAIISESRSASVRNRDRHHLGTLIAIARNTHTSEWVEYAFEKPATVSECRVYWFDDGPRRGPCAGLVAAAVSRWERIETGARSRIVWRRAGHL